MQLFCIIQKFARFREVKFWSVWWNWERKFPFNARKGDYSGRYVFGYNSPAAIAREVFKASTGAASLLDSIKKHFFDLG